MNQSGRFSWCSITIIIIIIIIIITIIENPEKKELRC